MRLPWDLSPGRTPPQAATFRPRRLPRPQCATVAHRSGPQRGAVSIWLVLDRRLRMG